MVCHTEIEENLNLEQSIFKVLERGERINMTGEEEPVIIIGGYPNYGHFVFEFLPKSLKGLNCLAIGTTL